VYIHTQHDIDWFYDIEKDQFWPFTDDTTDSHILIGPFRLGTVHSYGMVIKLYGVLAKGSDDVDWHIVKGETAEDAADNGKMEIQASVAGNVINGYVGADGTWSAGRSYMTYPRVRSPWCCLWLHSEGDWAYENIVMETVDCGRWR
jgi:hypothetical protein